MKKIFTVTFLILISTNHNAQLKILLEDFEGFYTGTGDIKANGFYTYGNLEATADGSMCTGQTYSGKTALKIEKKGTQTYGGWGKGVTLYMNLDASTDYFNFYFYQPASSQPTDIRIELQDDDNEDNQFNKNNDDSWYYIHHAATKDKWELVSIPLSKFKDSGAGGDGNLNISYGAGKLLGVIFSFADEKQIGNNHTWYFDFLCFSKGKLPTGVAPFDAPLAVATDFCSIGAWSEEGNIANFADIAASFESNFKGLSSKKLGVVHFFQPFGLEFGLSGHYPSAERINKVIDAGYLPMITLENHFVRGGTKKQPNLYSIVEGHFDSFFGYWAKLIKDVKGTVWLRMFHEFNGDWYEWCTVKNDKNPELVARAYRYVVNIFRENNVTNVKFIWCPNSMSVPQQKWNDIMYAYPGDEYVDLVGLDIYNGAGNAFSVWRSFRKEGIENYFVLTEKLPHKPLLICEVASRERRSAEKGQNKAEWIGDMSEALRTDMSKIRLITWFNEKETFRVNSSSAAKKAFAEEILNQNYFKNGAGDIKMVLEN